MVDRKITGLEVAGSNPVTITFYFPVLTTIGRFFPLLYGYLKEVAMIVVIIFSSCIKNKKTLDNLI
jgi:hypothetical protein